MHINRCNTCAARADALSDSGLEALVVPWLASELFTLLANETVEREIGFRSGGTTL